MSDQRSRAMMRPSAGSAILSAAVGVVAIAALLAPFPAAAVVGAIAIVVGLVSRAALKRDPRVRDARLSLLGFLLGCVAFVMGILPIAVPIVLALFGIATATPV
ncbi:hypothetical protein [Glaciihabitans sp. UYNi722]|uniref:hypothetical protein n=1 Tax=Glaciihabitans sp. UYNi722 TaxID=3156344 RepID=UPI00339A0F94